MNKLTQILKGARRAATSKLLVGGLLVLAIAGMSGWLIATAPARVDARTVQDCDNNAIVKCGIKNPTDLVNKAKGSNELANIYAHYGLQSGDYDRFIHTAKLGSVTKSGNIVVGGKTVATDAYSIGRQYMNGSYKTSINGKTYYGRKTSTSFVANSIPAYIMMNGDQVEFVALTSCGNPVYPPKRGTPPVFKCDALNATKISDDTYKYSTDVTAEHGAKVTKLDYNFGDGKTASTTSPSTAVSHTYKPGTYTAKVTVHFSANGGYTTTSKSCEHQVTIKQPPQPVYECTGLTAALEGSSKTKYNFTATAKVANGATLKSASFDFGDGSNGNGTVSGTKATASHDFGKTGTFTTTATLTFNVGSTTKTAKCEVTVKPNIPQPVYQCTGLAVTQKDRTNFEFKGTGSAQNATITGYRYTVKDNSGATVFTKDTDASSNTVAYNQTKVGSYTVSVQVIVNVNGETKVTPVSDTCTKPFTVQEVPAVAECTGLTAKLQNGSTDTYDFTTATHTEGNAQAVSYAYDFGDSKTQTGGATVSHKYDQAGEFTAKVTVTFNVNGQQQQKTSEACAVPVHVKQKECKPGVPVGSPECTPTCENGGITGAQCHPTCENGGIPSTSPECQKTCENGGIPSDSAECHPTCENGGIDSNSAQCSPTCENGGMSGSQCETPQQPEQPAKQTASVLPATGAETAVGGLFGSSALAYAGYAYRNSRRNIANRLFGRNHKK